MQSFTKLNNEANIVAFDYGTKRIGVAVGHTLTGSAQGICIVNVKDSKPDENRIDEIIQEWKPGALVVGVPKVRDKPNILNLRKIKLFGNWLSDRYGLAVHYIDESLTTEEAMHRIQESGRRHSIQKKTRLRNIVAAEIILETYLSSAHAVP